MMNLCHVIFHGVIFVTEKATTYLQCCYFSYGETHLIISIWQIKCCQVSCVHIRNGSVCI